MADGAHIEHGSIAIYLTHLLNFALSDCAEMCWFFLVWWFVRQVVLVITAEYDLWDGRLPVEMQRHNFYHLPI